MSGMLKLSDIGTPAELRMLAFHRQWWTDDYESFDFAVYADGKLELCKTNGDDRWGPNDESRYPACRVETDLDAFFWTAANH